MYSKSCTAQKVQKKKDEEAERLWRVQVEDQGDLWDLMIDTLKGPHWRSWCTPEDWKGVSPVVQEDL